MAIDSKSLMLGDWVYRPDCYDQVKEIRAGGIIGVDSLRGLIPFSQIEPIPLTPEILEKNGFVKSEHVSDTPPYDKDELGNMHFSLNGGFWGWWQPHEVFMIPANGLGWLEFKYVHELQHALKMCWIKKEIEL